MSAPALISSGLSASAAFCVRLRSGAGQTDGCGATCLRALLQRQHWPALMYGSGTLSNVAGRQSRGCREKHTLHMAQEPVRHQRSKW